MSRLAAIADLAAGDVVPESWVDAVRVLANYLGIAGADLASAATIQVTSAQHKVTGSTTIDNVTDPLGAVAGQTVRLFFSDGPVTVRHNGGGTGNVRLSGGLHAGFVAGEFLELVYDGANWYESHRSPVHLSGQGAITHNATTVPAGYLAEDGSAISRTTYAALFANVGTIFGSGDGSTTFNLPDSRGRVDVGHAASGGHADVSTIGANDGVAAVNRRPKHRTSDSISVSLTYSGNVSSGQATSSTDGSTGRFVVSGNGGSTVGLGVSRSGSVGTNNGNDPLDTPAYLVRPKLTRI